MKWGPLWALRAEVNDPTCERVLYVKHVARDYSDVSEHTIRYSQTQHHIAIAQHAYDTCTVAAMMRF